MTVNKRFVIGDEEYTEEEKDEIFYIEPPKDGDEVNTSYDQDQEIGDSPNAQFSLGAEPIDAKTGEDFYSIQTGGKAEGMGGFEGVWKQLGYESYGMPADLLSNEELINAQLKLKGGFDNVKYLNDIESEMRERGLEGFYDHIDLYNPDPDVQSYVDYKCKECGHEFIEADKDEVRQHLLEEHGITDASEKLNKDGTGTAVARRGINPKNKKHMVMKFDYVSQSDCKICKQYDGHVWGRDSPNRPVIPRLESVGKNSDRPYTHPNCKCRWTKVFKEGESKASEMDMDPELIAQARTRADDPKVFDSLTRVQRDLTIIRMLRKDLGMEFIETLDPVPLASMAVMTFDAIKEPIKHKLGIGEARVKANEDSPYRVQPMLDAIVAKSLGKEEKAEIEDEVSGEFTLDNLLRLVADKLASKTAKKLGLESRKVKGNERDMLSNRQMNDQAYDIMAEEEWGKSVEQLTDAEYKWIEDLMQDYGNELTSADKPKANEFSAPEFICPNCENDDFIYDTNTFEYICKECRHTFTKVNDWTLKPTGDFHVKPSNFESRKVKASENIAREWTTYDEEDYVKLSPDVLTDKKKDEAEEFKMDTTCDICGKTYEDHISVGDHNFEFSEGWADENWKETLDDILDGSIFMGKDKAEFKKSLEADKKNCPNCGTELSYRVADDGKNCDNCGYKTDDWGDKQIFGEGGKGSGKLDHRPWMLGAELGNVCVICQISTEWEGSICTMCGTDSKTL